MRPEERRRHLAKLDPFSKKRSAAAYLRAYLDDDTEKEGVVKRHAFVESDESLGNNCAVLVGEYHLKSLKAAKLPVIILLLLMMMMMMKMISFPDLWTLMSSMLMHQTYSTVSFLNLQFFQRDLKRHGVMQESS